MTEEGNIRIAILGMGTVGYGVFELLKLQREELKAKTGLQAEIGKILVRVASRCREGVPQQLLTDCFDEILLDETIDIIVEVMGGIHPAYEYIAKSLRAGKNVVTANKDLMAVHGGELLDLAHQTKRDLLFEASVAGGIPIIQPMKQCLAGNCFSEVVGIVNGTTNYILT